MAETPDTSSRSTSSGHQPTPSAATEVQHFPTLADMRTHPVDIYEPWCKRCQLCFELCPKDVFEVLPTGRVIVKAPQACIQCSICALHCPDYAILLEPKAGKQADSNDA